MYTNANIFLIEHPNGESAKYGYGNIGNINNCEFEHDIETDKGVSGSLIILNNKNINAIKVIGIHKGTNYMKSLNTSNFIGEIFNNENINILNNNNNCINN